MQPERRLVLNDVLVSIVPIFVGGRLVYVGDAAPWLLVPVVGTALLWGGIAYASDRDRYPDPVQRLTDRPFVVVSLASFAALASLVAVLLWPAVVPVYLAAFLGLGLAHLVNRLVFGVLRPVPEPALARAHQQGQS